VQASADPRPTEQHRFSVPRIVDPSTVRPSAKTLGDARAQLRHLAAGDAVTLHGPHGTFGDRARDADGDLLWVSGGIGITSLLSMLHAETAAASQPRRTIRLVWGVRDDADAVYDDEIHRLVPWLPHVSHHVHRERLGFVDHWGYVGEAAALASTVFLCGPVPMMRAVTGQPVERGVSARRILSEAFALR